MTAIEDFQSTTFAALRHEDLTVAEAWASSPLGDPAIEDASLSQSAESEDCPPTTVIAKPRSRGTNAIVAAAVVAGIGAVAGLGLILISGNGSNQHQKTAVVVPNSSVGSVAPQAPSAVPPAPVVPAPPAVATPPEAGQLPAAPAGGGGAPVWSGPAPAPTAPADPGIPAAPYAPADPGYPPAPPSVTVNVPPVIPVPIVIPVPPDKDGGQQGEGQPAPSGGGHGPIECLACHPQPIQQPPIHPQPIQQQPIHPQPIQQPIHPQPIQQQPIQQHH